jgi:hypothetical protein
MKIRNGFVSNSSSSSFCIIGTTYNSEIAKLVKAEGKNFTHYDEESESWIEGTDYLGYGCDSGKVVMFYGDDGPEYVGVEAVDLLEQHSLPEARKAFCKLVKECLNVDIDPRFVDLHYGEAGNG